jgi:predicted O-methyltransferase YrrM
MNKPTKALELSGAFSLLLKEEVELLAKMVERLPKRSVIVNIGAGVGTSSLTIAEVRPDLLPYLITVDVSHESPVGGLKNERNAFDAAGISPYPIQILADSKRVPATWRGWIEMLLIDGGHEAQEVYDDIVSWVVKVDQDGIIGIHDMTGDQWPEVCRVASAMMENFDKLGAAGSYVFYRMPRYFDGFPYYRVEDIP